MTNSKPVKPRIVAVGFVWNKKKQLLFCRMNPARGVFPGQWSFPGGGIEPGETLETALRRELREELGVEIRQIKPALFKEGFYPKIFADGSKKTIYMIFLFFHCIAEAERLTLNDEFVDYRWVDAGAWTTLDLSQETIDTLRGIESWESVYGVE